MSQPVLHWTLESVFGEAVAIPIGAYVAEVSVDAEVPMRGTVRQPRTGHRYWPTLIDLTVASEDGRESVAVSLHPETARALATALLAAAAWSDLIDLPDVDPCGHWAPCDCGKGKIEC